MQKVKLRIYVEATAHNAHAKIHRCSTLYLRHIMKPFE